MEASASMTAGSAKKEVRLLGPDPEPGPVDRLLEGHDRVGVEAPAEVPGGRRVGQALRPDAVEEHRVAAAQLDVVEPRPPHRAL